MMKRFWKTASRKPKVPTPTAAQQDHTSESVTELRATQEARLEISSAQDAGFIDGWRLHAVTAGLMLSLICSGLDRSIVAIATPAITSEFDSVDDVGWYGSAYLLTMCAFQLPIGKLFAELGMKWVYLVTMIIFEAGSVICAAATSSTVLIVGRAIAGMGGAGIIGGSLIMIGKAVSPSKRPAYLSVLGATANLAQAFGPLVGGVLVARTSWRWCFWINLPIGGVTAVILLLALRLPSPPPSKRRGTSPLHTLLLLLDELDIQSAALLIPSIVSLLLALQWGGVVYPWNSWRCILLLCIFCSTVLVWIYMQHTRGNRATVPFEILKHRSVAFGSLYTMAAFGGAMTMLYYLPIWFQAVRGDSASKAGIALCPLMLSWAAVLVLSAQLTARTGLAGPQMLTATVLMSAMTGLITRYSLETTTAYWATTLFFYGCGIGLGAQQPLIAVQSILKGSEIALGTSLIMFLQVMSGTIMVSVGQNLFERELGRKLAASAPNVELSLVLSAGNEGLVEKMMPFYTPGQVQGILVAYNQSLDGVFRFALVLGCLTLIGSLGMGWRNIERID